MPPQQPGNDPIILDENGEPITLDENGEPVSKQPTIKERATKFIGEHPMVRRLLFGASEEELAAGNKSLPSWLQSGYDPNIPIITGPNQSILPEMTHPEDEGWPGFIGRGLYNQVIRPLGSPEGMMGAAVPRIPIAKGKAASEEAIAAGLDKLKPPVKPQQKLLPGSRTTYVAGPIGNPTGEAITAEQAAYPEIASIASGEAIPMKSGPAGYSVDLDQIREQERLKSLMFGEQEQAGLSRVDIPDRPPIASPPVAGETKLGFEPVSRANLPYPLNVVPEAVRPRSMQEVTRSLVGSEMARPLPADRPPVEFVSPQAEPVKPPTPDRTLGGTAAIRPGEEILPSAPPKPTFEETRRAAKNVGVDEAKLAQASESAPPPIQDAINQVIREEAPRSRRAIGAIYTRLKPLPSGRELYAKSIRAVQSERQMASEWIPQIDQALRKLSKTEWKNFGGYVEGAIPITSSTVRDAVEIWRAAQQAAGTKGEGVGLRLFKDSKKWIPFVKHPGDYWPHIIDYSAATQKDITEKLMKAGMTRNQAQRVINHWRNTGEIVIGPQHARRIGHNLDYRLDGDVALQHLRSMAKRIAQHIEFGPMDVNGKGAEGISDLIETGTREERNLKLDFMKRIIGRNQEQDKTLLNVLNKTRKFAFITKLQNFSLANVALGQSVNAIKASAYPIASVKEMAKLISRRYRDELRTSGLVQDFAQSIVDEIPLTGRDWYGISAGETINRMTAGAIGRGVAKSAFKALKANSTNKLARNEIFELLGEEPGKVLQQSQLSDAQLRMAAGRMAERTQGLNVPGNLPYSFSEPVKNLPTFAWQLSLIFKKMGYQASRAVWESIKTDPLKAISTWLVTAAIGGEIAGDSRAFLRGIYSDDPMGRVDDRGSFWLENAGIPQSAINSVSEIAGVDPSVTARLFDNYMQSFFLGPAFDVMMSAAYGPSGIEESLLGPIFGDVSKLGYRAYKMDAKGAAKDVVSDLPVPGSRSLADYLLEP